MKSNISTTTHAKYPCIRCGKERVYLKSWEETTTNLMGASVITHTETVCPDPECQNIVEKEFAEVKRKKEEYQRIKETRRIEQLNLNKSQALKRSKKV